MLRRLEIRDMLIIDRLELALEPGLNVLTGETGAGKSILLDALGFVLGWRGRADLVREGAEQGEVTAEFDLIVDHPARAVLAEAGLPTDEALILRRLTGAGGRKQAFVNDRRVSGDILRALGETLVELHGQHDDRGLLNPRGHRQLLDAFGALDTDMVRRSWTDLRRARGTLEEAEAALAELRTEEEFLRHAIGELDALSPAPGEADRLDAERRLMQGASKILGDVQKAAQAMSLEGAEGLIGDAARWLDGAAGAAEGALDGALDALSRAQDALGEAQQDVERAIEAMSFDPRHLERVEERLFGLRGLARKHGVAPDGLAAFAEGLRARLARLDGGSKDLARLKAALGQAQTAFDRAAEDLSGARKAAARRLDKAMAAELAPLKMERAIFATGITPGEPGPDGVDTVAFTVATNPGAPAGPLGKIASGGELSRFLLALKVCLTAGQSGLTLIFDEIDRGVGGATADAVGRRLAALSQGAQVLVVTHSPQVAAMGGHHWRVEKAIRKGATLSTVTALDAQAREGEIARMLAGDVVTDAARAAARALLSG